MIITELFKLNVILLSPL